MPAPEDGDYFQSDWLRTTEKLPPREQLRIYGASDYAVTARGGDTTVHAVVGVDAEGRMYLLDLWRRQAASDVWVEAFCDLVLRWKPIGWAEEHGQIRGGVGPFLDRRMRERAAFVARKQFATRGDKSCAPNRSAAAWRWRAFMCRPARHGWRIFAPSC